MEDQGRVSRNNWWKSACPVSIIWCNREFGTLAEGQLGNTLIPSLDDLADSDVADEWFTAIGGGVKYVAIGECASVVYRDYVTSFGVICLVTARAI